MFNVKSYEELLNTYFNLLPDDMDRREGTLAYIMGSAMAMSLAELYIEMKNVEDDAYVHTASGHALEKVVKLLRMERRGKTKAVVRLEGDDGFSVGALFTNGEHSYKIISKEDGYYLGECTTAGAVGNSYIGDVLPSSPVTEFEGMKIMSIVAKGEEEEDDDDLRARFIERLNCPVCTGNLSYYREVLTPVAGVGGIKVVAVPNGAGTVKVIITNSDNEEASDELLSYVKGVLDPEETSGQGYGLVPIGHSVEVESAKKVDVVISLTVTGDSANEWYYRIGKPRVVSMFNELNKAWDRNERIVLRNRDIEDRFFEIGANDVQITSINGSEGRLVLEENQILGGVVLNGA